MGVGMIQMRVWFSRVQDLIYNSRWGEYGLKQSRWSWRMDMYHEVIGGVHGLIQKNKKKVDFINSTIILSTMQRAYP
jgi:hypothetical protein